MADNAAKPRDREPEVSGSSGSRRRRLPAIPPVRTIAGNGVGHLDSRRGGLTAEHNGGSSLTDVGTSRKSFNLINNDDLQPISSDGGEMRHILRIRILKVFLLNFRIVRNFKTPISKQNAFTIYASLYSVVF